MNDLILLQYGWGCRPGDGSGKTDCFQLVCEVMTRLGLSDYRSKFNWVYDEYTEDSFPRRKILRWLLENGTKVSQGQPGAVALLPGAVGGVLGAVTNHGLIFIHSSNKVVHTPTSLPLKYYFWMN